MTTRFVGKHWRRAQWVCSSVFRFFGISVFCYRFLFCSSVCSFSQSYSKFASSCHFFSITIAMTNVTSVSGGGGDSVNITNYGTLSLNNATVSSVSHIINYGLFSTTGGISHNYTQTQTQTNPLSLSPPSRFSRPAAFFEIWKLRSSSGTCKFYVKIRGWVCVIFKSRDITTVFYFTLSWSCYSWVMNVLLAVFYYCPVSVVVNKTLDDIDVDFVNCGNVVVIKEKVLGERLEQDTY